MKKWVNVDDRLPPDNWMGLVIADVRKDRPVFAHTADSKFRNNFPYAGYFIGKWRDALLIGDHLREKAKVLYWLDADEDLYPPIPK